jgi:hypothetical protein
VRLQLAATALAVALLTSGCDSSGSISACTLEPIDGTLIALPDGATAIDGAHWLATEWTRPVALRWPAGWTTSQATDGVVEVLDAKGTVKARTGEPFRFWAAMRNGPPMIVEGAMQVCPF